MGNNWHIPELEYIAKKTDAPLLVYKTNYEPDTDVPVTENPALQLRLKLWWGWPDASFPCMEVMIRKHLQYLENEGYIRGSGGEYELTLMGHDKLKGSLLNQLKKLIPEETSVAVARALTSAAMGPLIAWGEHFLRS